MIDTGKSILEDYNYLKEINVDSKCINNISIKGIYTYIVNFSYKIASRLSFTNFIILLYF